ncbi:hypothetical protein LWI28_012510 [Acer negundo]|uniref:CCHC-type domain-containing protein n=1 Tax=Acer negundo TaxID=4023 RepID=A0AAD5IZR3_ACENE|nr:hypothetical protein LWI28_012510 [Acer negundo]
MANEGKNDSNGNFIQPSIPRFDGHYDRWSMLMENFLRSKEFWSLVETGYVEPEAEAAVTEAQRKRLEELKLKYLKVKNYLFQAIDRTILETILEKNTSKQIWDSMKRKYEGNVRVKRSILQALRKEFETLEMKTGENITGYFARVMTVANKMRIYGEQMQDVTIVEKILRSLTDRFNYIVCSIEESKDIDVLSIDELQSSLIVHEQKFQKSSGEEQALKVTFEDRFGGRGRGRSGFRGGGRGRGRQAFDKTTVECYRCHKLGHFQCECPTLNKEANYAELDEEEEILLMSHVELHEARQIVKLVSSMALLGVHTDRGDLRVHESLEELSTDFVDYIDEISETSMKEWGVFAIALSGGSLIGLMDDRDVLAPSVSA